MFRQFLSRWLFLISILTVVLAGGAYWYVRATMITIAVGPEAAPYAGFIRDMTSAVNSKRTGFRFKIVYTSGAEESAKRLIEGKVHLAALRSDYDDVPEARALAILQRRTLFAIARVPEKAAKAKPVDANAEKDDSKPKLLDLLGRVPGVLVRRRGSLDDSVIGEVLDFFDRSEDRKKLSIMSLEEALEAFVSGKADLLILLAHPSEEDTRGLITAARRIAGARFALLAPPAAKGLVHQFRQLEASTIPVGVFGGNPPAPSEDMEAVAITYDLVATTAMSQRRAAHLTKTLSDLRSQLVESGGEFGIELPSLEQSRRFLPHAGTVAQINGESQTVLEEYSDIIWLGLFMAGGIGSVLSGLFAWLGLGRRRPDAQAS